MTDQELESKHEAAGTYGSLKALDEIYAEARRARARVAELEKYDDGYSSDAVMALKSRVAELEECMQERREQAKEWTFREAELVAERDRARELQRQAEDAASRAIARAADLEWFVRNHVEVVKQARAEGRAEERSAVVRWLRSNSVMLTNLGGFCGEVVFMEHVADVERGAHLRSTTEGGTTMQKPSIGRIVHYTNLGDADGKYPPEQQAAIVTGVNADGTVALHIFYKTGQFDMASVPFSEEYKRGHWTWPPRA